MDPKLSILITTADRENISLCLDRLHVLPMIDEVEVIIGDNSMNKDISKLIIEPRCKSYKFRYLYNSDFMHTRNQLVDECKTDWFLVLDDDDYLSVDSIPVMLNSMYGSNCSMISFGVEKEGRISTFDDGVQVIKTLDQKLESLSDFDRYEEDRLTKVYLWNCATLFNLYTFNQNNCHWMYPGCDDILPVTTMYLEGDVMKVNHPIYYYSGHNTTDTLKSLGELKTLESNMLKSYKLLVDRYLDDKEKLSIIAKSINNSIRQLEVLDQYTSNVLLNLKKCIS